jgi:hypothetical protein
MESEIWSLPTKIGMRATSKRGRKKAKGLTISAKALFSRELGKTISKSRVN